MKRKASPLTGNALVWISPCNLCVLCVSVVIGMHDTTTTETQRTQRSHREEFKLGHYPLTLVLLVFVAAFAPAMGQSSSCKVGVQAPPTGFFNWAPGSRIKVYVISSDFEDTHLPFVLAPLSNWNAVSESTGSKVRFEYKGTTAVPLYCENCLTIKRGQVFDKSKRHLTELRIYSARDRLLTWAIIVIDPLLISPKTLTNAVAHELGHSFGLLDCYSCNQKSTVMIQFKTVNASNEMDGPTACDVAAVKRAYQVLAAQLKRLPKPKPIVVDEGEEPADDNTPVVVPKP